MPTDQQGQGQTGGEQRNWTLYDSVWDQGLHGCDGNTWEVQLSRPSGGRNVTGPRCWEWMEKEDEECHQVCNVDTWMLVLPSLRGHCRRGLGRKVAQCWNKTALGPDMIYSPHPVSKLVFSVQTFGDHECRMIILVSFFFFFIINVISGNPNSIN